MTRRPLKTEQEPRRYADDWTALEALFCERQDPWDFLTDPYEQARLTRLEEIVRAVEPRSVLEIGCAEGVFTEWLTQCCDRVVALDVSRTACVRARQRAPRATVLESALNEYTTDQRFDLVVCAETLYYVIDVAEAVTRMEQLGRNVLVSYTRNEKRRLDPRIRPSSRPLVAETFKFLVRRLPPKTRACQILLWRTG